jgi:hypothetical protein
MELLEERRLLAFGDVLHKVLDPSESPPAYYGFGWKLASAGQYTVAGGAEEAYVFDCTTGQLLRTLKSPNTDQQEEFGWAVAISNNRAAVADDSDHSYAGGVGVRV